MKNNCKIAVVIPCFKVENTIIKVISGIPSYVDWIICVNDNSPDQTAKFILAQSDPRIVLITHKRNQGVGGAMLTGYSYCSYLGAHIIVKIDGDDQMDATQMHMLIDPILNSEADYVKGNRFIHSHELKSMPLIRLLGNYGLTFLAKLSTGYWNIFDPTNGYTAISSGALAIIDTHNISKSYFYEISMLCELRNHNAVVKDIPLPAIYRNEKSSLNEFQQLPIFFFNLIKRFLQRIKHQYFLYDFNLVSIDIVLGVITGLFGVIWGITKWVESAHTGIASTTGTVLIAVLPIVFSFQMFLNALSLDVNSLPKTTLVKRKPFPAANNSTRTSQLLINNTNDDVVIERKEQI